MTVAGRELTRAVNQFNILNEIRKSGSISRVELAERTNQSRSSVTNITAALIKKGLILEKETKPAKTRGRRRIMLAMNPGAAHVAGVKVSAHQVSFAVTDFQANILSFLAVPVRTSERPVEFLADVIEEGVRHCVRQAKLEMTDISGVGVSIPGFVDAATGTAYWTPLYKKGDAPLRDLIHERLGAPTCLENDANAITLAEQWFGMGAGVDNFIVVTVEEGVGMGIVVNGSLYTGSRGLAAEFGHMVMNPDGPPCRCGKRGCIEAYSSGGGILRAALEALAAGTWTCENPGGLTMHDIIELARNGDAVLRGLITRGGEMLGLGVAGLLQIFNPSRVIITGEYVGAGDMLFDPMRRVLRKHVHKDYLTETSIVIQPWSDTDWARGAASLCLMAMYKSPFESIRPVI